MRGVECTGVASEGGGLHNLGLLCEEDPPNPQLLAVGALGVTGKANSEHVIGVDGGTSTVLYAASSASAP